MRDRSPPLRAPPEPVMPRILLLLSMLVGTPAAALAQEGPGGGSEPATATGAAIPLPLDAAPRPTAAAARASVPSATGFEKRAGFE